MGHPDKLLNSYEGSFIKRALSFEVDKRGFIKGSVLGGVGLTVFATTSFFLPRDQVDPDEEKKYSFNPGWIEKGIQANLIDQDPDKRGHLNWLRQAIFNNPLLLSSTTEYYQYLQESAKKNERLKLGDILEKAFEIARGKFAEVAVNPRTSFDMEVMHAAAYVFAAGLNPWFTEEEMQRLGVNVEGRGVGGFFWDKEGVGTKTFPRVYGNGREDLDMKLIEEGHAPKYSGKDRAAHFAQHFLITFLHIYSENFNLDFHKKVPWILRKTVDALGFYSKERRAELFSELVGLAYEVVELRDEKNRGIPIVDSGKIKEGILEDMSWADIQANKLGANKAVVIFDTMAKKASPVPIFQALNNQGDEKG